MKNTQIEHVGPELHITLAEEIGWDEAQCLKESMDAALAVPGITAVLVDMTQLEAINSLGLGMLVAMRNKARQHEVTRFTLRNPSHFVYRTLEVAQLHTYFEVEHVAPTGPDEEPDAEGSCEDEPPIS